MNLEKSLAANQQLHFLESIDSTNLELARRREVSELPDLYALAASSQTRGQGRMGREWVSEPGSSLSLSVFFAAPELPELMPVLLAVAAQRVISKHADEVSIKWPNDILISGRKVSGLLLQVAPGGVVAGIGVNISKQHGAPETACALSEFADATFDDVLSGLLLELRQLRLGMSANPEAFASALIEEYSLHCSTINSRVRAELPGGGEIVGEAVGITPSGHLVLEADKRHELSAADVWHLRN